MGEYSLQQPATIFCNPREIYRRIHDFPHVLLRHEHNTDTPDTQAQMLYAADCTVRCSASTARQGASCFTPLIVGVLRGASYKSIKSLIHPLSSCTSSSIR